MLCGNTVINEPRYIDANAVLEKAWDADTRCGYVQVVDARDIENAPTVPVEIVVHCRDCKKRNTPRCNMTHNMGGGRFLTCNEDLGYCNLAEMKHIEINKGEEIK